MSLDKHLDNKFATTMLWIFVDARDVLSEDVYYCLIISDQFLCPIFNVIWQSIFELFYENNNICLCCLQLKDLHSIVWYLYDCLLEWFLVFLKNKLEFLNENKKTIQNTTNKRRCLTVNLFTGFVLLPLLWIVIKQQATRTFGLAIRIRQC